MASGVGADCGGDRRHARLALGGDAHGTRLPARDAAGDLELVVPAAEHVDLIQAILAVDGHLLGGIIVAALPLLLRLQDGISSLGDRHVHEHVLVRTLELVAVGRRAEATGILDGHSLPLSFVSGALECVFRNINVGFNNEFVNPVINSNPDV